MNVGDMVKQDFTETITRYGIIVEVCEHLINSLLPYYKICWLPNRDLPINGDDSYCDYVVEDELSLVLSVQGNAA